MTRKRLLTTIAVFGAFLLIGLWLWSAGDLLVAPAFALIAIMWLIGFAVVGLRRLFTDLVIPGCALAVRLSSVAWGAIGADPEGQRLRGWTVRVAARLRWLRSAGEWLADRVRPGRGGLRRTIAALVAAGVTLSLWRLSIAIGDPGGWVVGIDVRVADMAGRINDSGERALMLALTHAGRTSVMALIIGVLVLGAVAARAWHAAVLMLAITAGSALGVTILKAVTARARPDLGTIVETSASWPSGHASAGLALGLAVVVAWRVAGAKRWWMIGAFVLPIGLMIGYSRAYLTIHWSSDVVGGWLVAIATTCVVLVVDDVLQTRHRTSSTTGLNPLWIAGGVASLVFLAASLLGHDTVLPVLVDEPPNVLATSDPAEAVRMFEPYSETLTGRQIEPIALVIAASPDQLLTAITAAGWSIADPPTFRNLLAVYRAGITRTPDLTAPVTPTFFAGHMQDIAIEKPLDDSTAHVAERHHARLWKLPVILENGCPVWVATASLDDRVEWTWRTVLPNHHIAPAIDEEQAFVAEEFTASGSMVRNGTIRVTEPLMGTNAAGDPWFTNGLATVLMADGGCGA